MDNLTELLDKGIEAKRAGKFELAFDYINKAKEFSPTDGRVYFNSFKLYMGLKEYEKALVSLLILVHFNRIDKTYLEDELSKRLIPENKKRFFFYSTGLYKKSIFKTQRFEPTLVQQALEKDQLLEDLVFRADNLTFYIGHCVVGMYPKIIKYHSIPMAKFENLNNAVLGRSTGEDLRDSKFNGLFLCIGFIFSHMNLVQTIKTKQEVVDYFSKSSILLNFDIGNYRIFLQDKIDADKNSAINTQKFQSTPLNTEYIKIFKEKEFIALTNATQSIFKLPEEGDNYYFLAIIPTDEKSIGLGPKQIIFHQHWELNDEKVINGKQYFIFKMWGFIPMIMRDDSEIDASEHEGKKIAVQKNEILYIISTLHKQGPEIFSKYKLLKTNILKNSIS